MDFTDQQIKSYVYTHTHSYTHTHTHTAVYFPPQPFCYVGSKRLDFPDQQLRSLFPLSVCIILMYTHTHTTQHSTVSLPQPFCYVHVGSKRLDFTDQQLHSLFPLSVCTGIYIHNYVCMYVTLKLTALELILAIIFKRENLATP